VPRLYALILSGGAGTRLWPLSRRRKPKQFLDLVGDRTMLQDTVDRVSELIPNERIFVVAPPEHRALIHEQLAELRNDHVVIEPYPRGNAAAIGLAMAALHAFDPDAVVAVLPSDHVIGKQAAFRNVLLAATAAADAGWLVTLGIVPDAADTGFGYIEAGEQLDIKTTVPVHRVKRFVEKPKKDESVLAEVWEETDRTTVDYGIAERAKNMAVVPADIGWQDVGSWSRLADIVAASARQSADEHIAEDSVGNYVHAPGKTTVTIGVNDLIVVETDDVLFIAAKDRAEEVKAVVDRLAREEKEHLL